MSKIEVFDADSTNEIGRSSSSSIESCGGESMPRGKTMQLDPLNDAETGAAEQRPPILPGGIASMTGSIFNLAKTILGVGILSLPNAFSKSGAILGCLLLVLASLCAAYGVYLLIEGGRRLTHPRPTWFILSKATYPKLRYLSQIAILIKCYGVACSYIIVVGSLMSQVMVYFMGSGYHGALVDRHLWIAISGIIAMPFSFFRHLSHLKYLSALGLATIVFLIVVILYEFGFITLNGAHPQVSLFIFRPLTLSAIPSFVFAYTCHHNAFTIYNELRNNTRRRMNLVIFFSFLFPFVMYFIAGFFGYLTFGKVAGTQSNILTLYPQSVLVNICRITMAFQVAATFPLQAMPFRTCCMDFFEERFPRVHRWKPTPYLVIAFFIAITYLTAFLVTDLGFVFAIVGSTGSNLIAYILPGLFYLKITSKQKVITEKTDAKEKKSFFRWFKFGLKKKDTSNIEKQDTEDLPETLSHRRPLNVNTETDSLSSDQVNEKGIIGEKRNNSKMEISEENEFGSEVDKEVNLAETCPTAPVSLLRLDVDRTGGWTIHRVLAGIMVVLGVVILVTGTTTAIYQLIAPLP